MLKSILKNSLLFLTGIMIIGLCAVYLSSCQPKTPLQGDSAQEKKQEDGVHQEIKMDTVLKIQIDTIVDHINHSLRNAGPPHKIPYHIYNDRDTIFYWLLDDYSGRISIELEPKDSVVWPVFYVYKKEIIRIRYRFFSDVPGTRKAYESNIYLDKGIIVYCEDRGRALADGEAPYVVRQLTHSPSTRTIDEIKADYTDVWNKILPLLKADSPVAREIFN